MEDKFENHDINFKKKAIYKIIVKGSVNKNLSNILQGMQIYKDRKDKTESSLIGMISDQAALSSILNTLYENHLTVISVNMLEIKN